MLVGYLGFVGLNEHSQNGTCLDVGDLLYFIPKYLMLLKTGFHLLTQDSGQIIPLIVESCIRFINLYGKP